jgi:hypothetical protein
VTADSIEHVVERGCLCEVRKFRKQKLLEGLTSGVGATLQLSMYVVWELANQHVGHACIVLSAEQMCQGKCQGKNTSAGTVEVFLPSRLGLNSLPGRKEPEGEQGRYAGGDTGHQDR